MSDDRIHPFSNGTQFMDWREGSCCQCAKYHVNNGAVEPVCPLDEALFGACCGDGTISREIADRLGVPENTWSDWQCKEFEPERPAGVERIAPAPGQLSLF